MAHSLIKQGRQNKQNIFRIHSQSIKQGFNEI